MTDKTEKDNLWGDLKKQWSYLKRDSGADEVQKGSAKERINEIQEKLKLDKTNWDAPRGLCIIESKNHKTRRGNVQMCM